MAVKSIIDVEVNDEAFQRFQKLFEKYQSAVQTLPKSWGTVGKEIAGQSVTFEKLAALLLAQAALSGKHAASEREAANAGRRSAGYWHSLVKSSREFVTNVSRATHSILRIAGVGSIFGGLLGLGGLFGLDRLAGTVGAGRRSALGLGISYGAQRAFTVEYGRVVEPGGFLAAISESLRDVTKRSALYGAGFTEAELAGKSTGQVAVEMIRHLKSIADRTPTALLAQQLQALGLGQFISLQEFQRLKATPATELAGYQRAFFKERAAFGLSPVNQRIWQDFAVQMNRAGAQIENVFVRGLRPLIPSLGQLSGSFARAIQTFLGNKHLGEWIAAFGKGIERVAKYIGSDEFQNDVTRFANGLSGLATAIENFLGLFGVSPKKGKDIAPSLDYKHGVGGFAASVKQRAEWGGLVPITHERWWTLLADPRFQNLEKRYRLPQGLIWNLYGAESEYGKHVGPSRAGAVGPFQFMPETARERGLVNPYDTKLSAEAAAREMVRLLSKFHGDLAESVAAYNWGEGRVSRDIARYGTHWREHLPRETRDYLSKVLKGAGLKYGVQIKVQNETGNNVNVSANQVAQ